MLIAQIKNGQVIEIADHRDIFPNISFPDGAPNEEFLTENGCMIVSMLKQYDPATQTLKQVEPYIEGGTVFTVQVVELTPEEMEQRDAAKRQQNKAQAESLLQATDWTATVDIADPQYSNPRLGNQDAFLAYRSQVRQIAVNPPVTVDVWPTNPDEVWVRADIAL